MGKQGFVLMQVLVTALIVAIIAAGIIQVVLLRSTIQARTEQGNAAHQDAQGAFNKIMTAWNQNNGQVCSPVGGWGAGGTPGTCGCQYSNGNITVTTCTGNNCTPSAQPGTCGLQMTAPLPQ